ncbi:MAG: DUF3368 domain-containing protein [Prosthecobacter sp.]|jgi:predicted nucleic acid-binding protein|uniref:hypothetical protein n=1 Tax=Prosthecobacter sp. TaxID=1965333 RepID=UPI0019FBA147|nr:hypothetical protein [Prosthecobacter sp.]MBE2283955.1 DUF3368 domain-containing protein [Prosthecobacter sp.]
MLVISDTSPLTALLLSRREELLRLVFGRVVIPPAVQSELLKAHRSLPVWIEVLKPAQIPQVISDAGLDAGETEAIALALELQPDALLMDERLGRKLAQVHHLRVTGLLGFFVLAKNKGLVAEVAPLIREAQKLGNCWFGEHLIQAVCSSVGEPWS